MHFRFDAEGLFVPVPVKQAGLAGEMSKVVMDGVIRIAKRGRRVTRGFQRLWSIAMGIRTVGAIRLSSDKTLSGVKGLGTAKIAGIRAFCDAYKGDPDAEHLMESE